MNSKNPLVSVVVPSYNHEKFIEKCIISIINQTYKNFELIVIDDGSSDNSVKILKDLQIKYNFYLEVNKNQGLSKTLNRGFRDLAKGQYLTFCASDDIWFDNKLELQVNFLKKNTEYAMVYGKVILINEQGFELTSASRKTNARLKGGQIFKDLILIKFHPPVNYMFRKNTLEEVGYYREHIWAEDFDMNLRIANKYLIGFLDEYLFYYRSGINSKRKMLTFNTIYSHLDSINLFKTSPYYKEAIQRWHLRNFAWYSQYVETKFFAIKELFFSIKFFYTKTYINALRSLFFKWN
jgi:glycosyltransferase involved in cell wall biosynthesis